MAVNFSKRRTGSMDIVMAGNEVNQTLSLYNGSEYDITDVYIVDTITSGATFKARSLQIDGTSYVDFNPIKGFKMPMTIKQGNSETVTYKVTVDDPLEVSKIELTSAVTYTVNGETVTENSNTYVLSKANGDIIITKTSNKSAVIKGQTLTFQTEITNIGNIRNTNVFFKDPIPSGTSFVEGSVKINNVAQSSLNPTDGFSVPNIDPNAKAVVSFDVTIN